MLVLGIETATDVCAVGLVDASGERARPLAEFSVLRPRRHGAALAPLVRAALDAAGEAPEALGAVAVSAGPGSYTGLRIGVSTAKGLCMATGAALVAVPTTWALASGARTQAGPATVVCALPSRRGEVYAAAYRVDDGHVAEVRPPTALALTPEAWAGWVPPSDGIGVVGPATAAVLPIAGGTARALDGQVSGAEVARLGLARLRAGQAEDVGSFEPDYLKGFVSGDGRSGG